MEAGALAEEIGDLHIAGMARLQLGVIVLDQYGADLAEPVLEEALVLCRRHDNPYQVACALLVLGWTATDRRAITTAAARYAESLTLWEELGTQEGMVDVLAGVAKLAGAARQPERAARLLAATQALGERLGYVLPVPESARYDRTRAELRSVLGEAAFTAEWTAGLAFQLEHALVEGRAVLAELLEGRVADAPSTAVDSLLTLREREVLRLVVAGYSNPEIADTLFLSRRTVTTHLTRIFAKLGVQGRAEAAVHAVRHGLT
jgi:DNA-binding CsgD family transcriptional regulator